MIILHEKYVDFKHRYSIIQYIHMFCYIWKNVLAIWQPFKLYSVFEFLTKSSESCATDITVGAESALKHVTSLCERMAVSHLHLVIIPGSLYLETSLAASHEKESPPLLSDARYRGFESLENRRKVDHFSALNSNLTIRGNPW